jgi:hypothetical protein
MEDIARELIYLELLNAGAANKLYKVAFALSLIRKVAPAKWRIDNSELIKQM